MSGPRTGTIVVVTGDVTFDWNLAHSERGDQGEGGWTAESSTRACWQRGGAALLTRWRG